MNTLAIDVGGTKFTLAAFEGDRMVLRESQATDREAGRDWMLPRLSSIARDWQQRMRFDHCGIGFGGPVNYQTQRVALSTHAGGWNDFDFPAFIRSELGLQSVMDNDANVGGLGEGAHGAGLGLR